MGKLDSSQLHIKDDYFDLVPRPEREAREDLKRSMAQDGQLIPIVVNPEGTILDGIARWEICLELDVEPNFVVKEFEDEDQERNFIILSNLARRHLTKFQKIELAWEIYEKEKQRAHRRMISQGGSAERRKNAPSKEGMSSEIFGKYFGTGHTAVGQIEYLKKNAPEDMLERLRSGDITRGLALIPKHLPLKPKSPPTECPVCFRDIVSKKSRKCHVHRWYCCSNCKWGI